MGITHKWTGSILTITSDSGTSSMDLQGPRGNKGCRGPQGRAGCIVKPDGTVDMTGYATETYVNERIEDVVTEGVDLSEYYTKEQVLGLIDGVEANVDLTGYATETFVTSKIAAAQFEAAGVDVSGFVTKDEMVGGVGTGTNAEIFNYDKNIASGNYSHAEGLLTEATKNYAHAEGNQTKAYGEASHAEGRATEVSGNYSHAEGSFTKASGYASHAEGNYAEASGYVSHAEGSRTVASGLFSHAEGDKTEASGTTSHAQGKGTIANRASQHVEGEYNIADVYGNYTTDRGKYIHIAGNGYATGEDDSTIVRSNAYTLDWDGNAWFAGKVYVGGTSMYDATELGTGGGSGDCYTKAEVDALIPNLDNYTTKDYVSTKIAEAQLEGADVDLSGYATKEYIGNLGYQTRSQVMALIQASIPASGDEVSY